MARARARKRATGRRGMGTPGSGFGRPIYAMAAPGPVSWANFLRQFPAPLACGQLPNRRPEASFRRSRYLFPSGATLVSRKIKAVTFDLWDTIVHDDSD